MDVNIVSICLKGLFWSKKTDDHKTLNLRIVCFWADMFESFTGQNAELYRLGRYAEKYNFDEASIDWIQSYLGKSKQCVKIESKTSELLYCEESGEPQSWF